MTFASRSAFLLAVSAALVFAAFPRMVSVEPGAVQPGEEAVANGSDLGPETVAKLFLTAGGKDIPIEMAERDADSIRFTVPADIDLGAYNLMVQTAGPTPALMEQPVRLQVLDAAGLEEWKKSQQLPPPPPPPTAPAEPPAQAPPQ